MKIVFMGTPDFAIPTLEKLNEISDVSLVVSQVDKKKGRGKKLLPPPVKEEAIKLGIEVFQPENINSQTSIEKLKNIQADIFVVVAYGQILSKEVLQIPKLYCINVHASLLPYLRGAAPINRAIIDGFEESGVSIMKMEEGLDSGDVALQKSLAIKDKNAYELENALAKMGAELIEEFLINLDKGTIQFKEQDHSKMTYAKKITKSTFNIEFSKTSEEILNLIRGLDPYYGARAKYKDEIIKIFKAYNYDYIGREEPGTILDNNKKLIIKTGDGAISVEELQIPGKKRMDIKSFLLGHNFDKNERLG